MQRDLPESEAVGNDETEREREQRAADTRVERAEREGDGLGARDVDAVALRHDLVLADRHQSAADLRLQDALGEQIHDGRDRQQHVVLGVVAADAPAEEVRAP